MQKVMIKTTVGQLCENISVQLQMLHTRWNSLQTNKYAFS
jgi:hypothetical protein